MVVFPAPGGIGGTDLFPNHDRTGKRAPKGTLADPCWGARSVVESGDYFSAEAGDTDG
jgi:hypothetical protein